MENHANLGMIGMAVMGRNLGLNMLDRGHAIAVWNRDREILDKAVQESDGRFVGASTLADLVNGLERPRKIMMMIKAGEPVDKVIAQVTPHLEKGDILIDGGNSWFEDTRRREKELAKQGVHFFGVGVSGGEEGARHGPSLMPGGDRKAYGEIEPILTSIAATTDSGPCVTYVGSDGAGHFVKMVHNGIEYADMQLIAEAYHLLKGPLGLSAPELQETFGTWNDGQLQSFLIEITGKIFSVKDPETGAWLVDKVLDKAGQKGTGRWTVQAALELGVPVTSIAAAVDARTLSSMKDERMRAAEMLGDKKDRQRIDEKRAPWISMVHDALYAAKIISYAQGMALIDTASRTYQWSVDLRETARIWKGGCIIRARFLDGIMEAFGRGSELGNLMLDQAFSGQLITTRESLQEIIHMAHRSGVPVPAMSASLAYYDSYRSPELPQNLTQAQRDAFGAHTYQRNDQSNPEFIHSDWLG
jgi:6-phosphogluconate dehydrogenase